MKTHKKHTNKQVYEMESGKAYLIFEKKLSELLTILLDDKPLLELITEREKLLMFGVLYRVKSPRRAHSNMIATKELRYINKIYQQMLRKEDLNFDGLCLSVIDYNIFAVFHYVIEKTITDQERKASLKKSFNIPEDFDVEKCVHYARLYYFSSFYKIMTRVCDVRKKFYSFEMLNLKDEDGSETTSFTPVVSACCPIQKKLKIHNRIRPVFKLGVPHATGGFQWVKIKKNLLGDYYKGDEGSLDMYVQSHALDRMKERLDVFDQMTLNHILCLNVTQIESFEHYRGYLLLPVNIYEVKIGYLVCNVIDDYLVIRSFLFITHSCTPEGDKLKEITGLKRYDISYWKIDRLSTLIQVDEEHQPELLPLFREAGIQDIMKLKDYDLDIEALQNVNMADFVDYLKQSEVKLPEAIQDLPQEVLEKKNAIIEFMKENWKKNKIVFVVGLSLAIIILPIHYIIRKIKKLKRRSVSLES